MEKTLSALGDILLKALPTFFLVICLYIYLRRQFFQPLAAVLEKRREATEGARQRAQEIFQKAEQKAAEYEAALDAARGEFYREQQAERERARQRQAARVIAARAEADVQLREVRGRLASDAAAARQSLAAQSEALAEQILRAVLEKGAAA